LNSTRISFVVETTSVSRLNELKRLEVVQLKKMKGMILVKISNRGNEN
jgi:hypothetical protein